MILDFIPSDVSRFLIAYSGGIDSHVLLHRMLDYQHQNPAIQLRAIHVHHGLSPNADAWLQHCEKICRDAQIEFISAHIEIHRGGGNSLEAQARSRRYQVMADHLFEDECLLTAHNADDQAETVLLQLLRGAGPKGLSAMPICKFFGSGIHCRPLLAYSRAEIEAYAHLHQLHWIEDESNVDLRFDRNYIRHQIMPVLKSRWPSAVTTINRVATHCQMSQQLCDQLAQIDLETCHAAEGSLLLVPLLQLSLSRQVNVIRFWLHQRGFHVPDASQLDHIISDVLHSDFDAQPCVRFANVEVRRSGDHIYALQKLLAHEASMILAWDLTGTFSLPNGLGELQAELVTGEGIRSDLVREKFTVRFRQGGEHCQPQHRQHTHALKKLMQEWKIPAFLRDRVPLIYYGEELAAVVGYCIDKKFAASLGEAGIWIKFTY